MNKLINQLSIACLTLFMLASLTYCQKAKKEETSDSSDQDGSTKLHSMYAHDDIIGNQAVQNIDIFINGYDLLQSRNEDSLFQKVGRPYRTSIDGPFLVSDDYAYYSYNYIYADNEIKFHGDEIYGFIIKDDKFDINGVRIGDNKSKIIEAFGENLNHKKGKIVVYPPNGMSLSFEMDSLEIVKAISLTTNI